MNTLKEELSIILNEDAGKKMTYETVERLSQLFYTKMEEKAEILKKKSFKGFVGDRLVQLDAVLEVLGK